MAEKSTGGRKVVVFCCPFDGHTFAHSAARRFNRGKNVIEAEEEITDAEIAEIRNDPGHRFEVTVFDEDGEEIAPPAPPPPVAKKRGK